MGHRLRHRVVSVKVVAVGVDRKVRRHRRRVMMMTIDVGRRVVDRAIGIVDHATVIAKDAGRTMHWEIVYRTDVDRMVVVRMGRHREDVMLTIVDREVVVVQMEPTVARQDRRIPSGYSIGSMRTKTAN
jgi:hypothetical protein